MKKYILLVFLFIYIKSIAQPGFTERYQEIMLKYYSDTLLKDTANYELIWKRVNMLFNPYFDLFTQQLPVIELEHN